VRPRRLRPAAAIEETGPIVRITVLGKSPSWQDADGACSGYLVEGGGVTVLLDCGNGVFGKLRRYADYVDVDAVLISHLHADHFLDLVPYSYALTYGPRQQGDAPARPRLYGPPGAREVFRRIVGSWGTEELIERAFALTEYAASDELQVGPLGIRFQPVPHYTATNAVQVSNGGERLTFGADHRPNEELSTFAAGSDLLLIEATLTEPEPEGPRGHLTPGEAGEHGRRANARRLVLTHISDEVDPEWARREAEATFGGAVEIAREGAVYTI
jgi:ribonuclease BN (tRNA processing enzyme)